MKNLVKHALKKTPLYVPVRNWLTRQRYKRELLEWERRGKPVPPPHLAKQRALQAYADKFGLTILVETGTLYGEMIEAMRKTFSRLYSIELSDDLFEKATRRFAGHKHIEIIHGDSGVELGKLVGRINQPALFWLDGHYSEGLTAKGDKDTPIFEELDFVLSAQNKGHVIVIDDARCFGVDPAYPSIQALTDFVKSRRPDLEVAVRDDSIRITPPG